MPSGEGEGADDITFTLEQRRRLIKMLEDHEKNAERRAWLKETGRIWLKWLGGVLAVLVAAKTLIGEYLKGVLR